MSFIKSIKNVFGIEIERPPYELLKKIEDNIEIRKYAPSKWVCTKSSGEAVAISNYSSSMFGKLFKYISGQNATGQKIAMTSPVTVDYKNATSDKITPVSNVQMVMRFYVPHDQQADTPTPTGEAYIAEDPEMTVAVIKFGGYATTNEYIQYRDILIKSLQDEAAAYDCVNIITAGYDPPFKPIGRTNEVWLRKIA